METIDLLGKVSRRSLGTVIDTDFVDESGDALVVFAETVYDKKTNKFSNYVGRAKRTSLGALEQLTADGGIFMTDELVDKKFSVKQARAEHTWFLGALEILVFGSGDENEVEVEALRDLLAGARVRRSNYRKEIS